MKKIRVLKSIIANGFTSIWRNKGMGLGSLFTIFSVMLLIGLLLLLVLNVNDFVNSINNTLDQVAVYLYDDTSGEDTRQLIEELSIREEVDLITYISKEEAIVDARKMFDEESYVLEGLKTNPLPATIQIKINDIDKAGELVSELERNNNVETVRYFQYLIEQFLTIDRVIKLGSFIAFVIIVLLSIFVIFNIIKVAISARGKEIEIMKYVGASESFIKGPFIIEGLFYSIIGSLGAYFLVDYLYNKFADLYSIAIYEYIAYNIIDFSSIKVDLFIIFISMAIGIGTIGSIISIRKYLKV